MRRFEFVEGSSKKFWEITLDGSSFTVAWGRIGTAGQSQVKSFPTDAKAKSEHDKLIAEKTKKGYGEVGVAPAEAAAEPSDAAQAAPRPAPTPRAPRAPAVVVPVAGDGWIEVEGYGVQIRDGGLVARNAAGRELASLPKGVKDSDRGEILRDAVGFLNAHEAECRETAETWMLRSLPVPRKVIEAVWADPAWRAPLANLIVDADGVVGLLRAVEARGLGVVDLDGETRWINASQVAIPHPILVDELDEWRGLSTDLGVSQGIAQLFRETFPRPTPGTKEAEGASVDTYAGGNFDLLATVLAEAKRRGYRVSGGCAVCRVWSPKGLVEARYEVGEGDPMGETTTGSLRWVDSRQASIPLVDVGPVAFSEGMRMAALLYAKRKIEQKSEDEDV